VLGAEGNDLGGNNGFVAEMRVVVSFELKESLPFCDKVNRKQIFDSRLLKTGFLVFLFSPIVTSIKLVFLV